ncbi:MAG: dihydropteroate synthase [Planctomycetia bacterium]|nr:dihydropteroate synthase [Planctomycetia bacterium]
MPLAGLTIIGESINDSVPSTHAFYEEENYDAIAQVARSQTDGGAGYIDVNVGSRPASVMQKTVLAVQKATTLPLAIDSPDYEQAQAGLAACDSERPRPILNSISQLRMEMFDLYKQTPFCPILLLSEYKTEQGDSASAATAEQSYGAACDLFEKCKSLGMANDQIIFDPGVAPLAGDTEGNLARLIRTMELIHANPDMKGVHASVGLSNFTVMLPAKTKSGAVVKSPLESAFLTLTMPLGMDHVIGSVKRKYQLLAEEDPALLCVRECLEKGGFESIARVRRFIRS